MFIQPDKHSGGFYFSATVDNAVAAFDTDLQGRRLRLVEPIKGPSFIGLAVREQLGKKALGKRSPRGRGEGGPRRLDCLRDGVPGGQAAQAEEEQDRRVSGGLTSRSDKRVEGRSAPA